MINTIKITKTKNISCENTEKVDVTYIKSNFSFMLQGGLSE